MNRQLYGIGNLVEREQYGIGSKLKKFVRNIIPNEVASIASAAAPFVAPFNPLLAAGMAGLGSFDRTGSISGGLKAAALTYGGGQIARGIGGAGFQTGFNPFDAASLGQSASSFIGVPYSSPIGTTTGLQLGQYTDAGKSALNQMETFGGTPTAGTLSKTPGTLDQLKTIFDPTSGVDFGTRAQAAVNLTGDAIKAMYTNKDGTIDKRMVISTLAAIPSYLDAKKKADQIGLSANEFNEQIYNEQKAMFQTAYQSRLPMESFGIRTTAQMGGIMGGLQQQQEEPIFPRLETLSQNLGQAEQTLGEPSNQFNASSITTAITGQQPQKFAEGGLLSIQLTPRSNYLLGNVVRNSGVAEPVSGPLPSGLVFNMNEGGGGVGTLIKRIISNNPNMFQQQPRSVSINPVNDLYKYYLENGTDEDYKRRIMESIRPKFAMAMGGRINYETGSTPAPKTLPMDLESLAQRLFNTNLDNLSYTEKQYLYDYKEQNKNKKAKGGSMGSEIPTRQNQGGITELDLRAKGGYIPVGIKEKADDVPAMLSKNEFVFTADAVRGAGNGSINKGAQKMYKLMKSLEKKVKKVKVA